MSSEEIVRKLEEIYTAINRGDLEKTKKLMTSYNHIIESYILMNSIVNHVAEYGRNKVASYIFNLPGIDINNSSDRGETPLMRAIRRRNEDTFELLLNHKDIDINKEVPLIVGRSPQTALHVAADHNRDDFLQRLLNHRNIELNDEIIAYLTWKKPDILLRSQSQSSLPFLEKVHAARERMNPVLQTEPLRMSNALRNRAWMRRGTAIKAWVGARNAENREEEAANLHNKAVELRRQLTLENLTPSQKAGIAARARALTKKANNFTRNSRKSRRRSTRRVYNN